MFSFQAVCKWNTMTRSFNNNIAQQCPSANVNNVYKYWNKQNRTVQNDDKKVKDVWTVISFPCFGKYSLMITFLKHHLIDEYNPNYVTALFENDGNIKHCRSIFTVLWRASIIKPMSLCHGKSCPFSVMLSVNK